MPRRKTKKGVCHLCGEYGDLTFEHVPPRAAFNNKRTIRIKFEDFEDIVNLGPDELVKGPIQQGGIGYYTLCARCNNITGSWYGKHFVDWCYQGMDILISTNGKPSLIYLTYIFPLSIIKQIITMFFSVIHENFRAANSELVEFVLNRERKYLSPQYRFFIYYNITGKFRSIGITGRVDFNTGKTRIFTEINYPPFGYVLTINSDPPDNRLVEITHFSRYDYNEFKVMNLKLSVLPTHLWFPGDYRTKKEINKAYKKNIEFMREKKIH